MTTPHPKTADAVAVRVRRRQPARIEEIPLEQPYGEPPRVEAFLDELGDGDLWGLLVEVAFHRSMDGLRHSTAYDTNAWLRALDRAGVQRPPNAGEPVEGEGESTNSADDPWFTDHAEFFANLPERSQTFLRAVHQRGELTITDALPVMDIDQPKLMGGITGSIARWCPVRRVPVPYQATIIEGERVWRWIGNGPA